MPEAPALRHLTSTPPPLPTSSVWLPSEREHIEEDEQRVARLFRAAPSKGVQLHQCSLNAQQLQVGKSSSRSSSSCSMR